MRARISQIKLIGLVTTLLFLFGFTAQRQKMRQDSQLRVKFLNASELYLSEEMVNKLLIQKSKLDKNRVKDGVVLRAVEEVIDGHPMVRKAEVFRDIPGNIYSEITQKEPIARVLSSVNYYLDERGKKMPLSSLHSARVPLITGKITGESLKDAYNILEYINRDEFLKKNIVGIHIVSSNSYQLRLRSQDFLVHLGDANHLEKKFKNFNAFYIKAAKDKMLNSFAQVNLEFDNQVVCTKI